MSKKTAIFPILERNKMPYRFGSQQGPEYKNPFQEIRSFSVNNAWTIYRHL